jgi:hypothetical protein
LELVVDAVVCFWLELSVVCIECDESHVVHLCFSPSLVPNKLLL